MSYEGKAKTTPAPVECFLKLCISGYSDAIQQMLGCVACIAVPCMIGRSIKGTGQTLCFVCIILFSKLIFHEDLRYGRNTSRFSFVLMMKLINENDYVP